MKISRKIFAILKEKIIRAKLVSGVLLVLLTLLAGVMVVSFGPAVTNANAQTTDEINNQKLDFVDQLVDLNINQTGFQSLPWILRKAAYDLETPVIDGVSNLGEIGYTDWIKNTMVNVTDSNVLTHEGKHSFWNTRYKEWWYVDAFANNGYVISLSVVLSVVDPHYFLWVYDPSTNKVVEIIMEDGSVSVNNFGSSGLTLTTRNISLSGRRDTGYTLTFNGTSTSGQGFKGDIRFSSPIPARGERHIGPYGTYIGLYQVPKMTLSGSITNLNTGKVIDMTGLGYLDHWWGIVSRYTKWNWMQANFTNGWKASMYDAKYDCFYADKHRYNWLYIPGQGYKYFDQSKLQFVALSSSSWKITATATTGEKLVITANKRANRHEFKPVILKFNSLLSSILGGPPSQYINGQMQMGEVSYDQYPITATAVYTDATGKTTNLTSSLGMLEWAWDAIW